MRRPSKPWGCGSSRPAHGLAVSRIGAVIATDAYELAKTAVALVDRSQRAKLLVTGAGAGEFLQGQVTNDVEALAPGEGCYAAFLNAKGKLRADVRVLRLDDGFWLDAEGYAKEVVEWVIDSFSVGLDVRREDLTEARALLSLIGPEARSALDVAPPADEHAHVRGEHGLYVATDLGVDVICHAADADGVRAALGADEVAHDVAEVLRVESGRPRLGLEMDGGTIPQEAALNERAVNFEKGCYVGQETVARLHYRGKPNRHLRGLRLSEPAERGAPIVLGEKELGKLGTACVSPALGPIALAIVRREAAPGDTVSVCGAPAELVELPFS
jgi:tRNA-modifying protein YgfZ